MCHICIELTNFCNETSALERFLSKHLQQKIRPTLSNGNLSERLGCVHIAHPQGVHVKKFVGWQADYLQTPTRPSEI